MPPYLAVRDKRLEGGVPSRPHLGIVNLDDRAPLRRAFAAFHGCASRGKIRTAFIFCHGFAGADPKAQISMDAGGMGLVLGRELVLHRNVHLWQAIRGTVEEIVVYACAAADTQPNNVGTNADGKYLMRALALHTQATVYAADRIQWYDTYRDLSHGAYDFGSWEGNLWRFAPDGFSAAVVRRAPVEFTDILSGCYS